MVNSVIYFGVYMCVIVNGSKLFETFDAGNINLLFEVSDAILPEIYSSIME